MENFIPLTLKIFYGLSRFLSNLSQFLEWYGKLTSFGGSFNNLENYCKITTYCVCRIWQQKRERRVQFFKNWENFKEIQNFREI